MKLFTFTLAGLRAMLVLTAILGIAYPAAVWATAQVVAPRQANGSMVVIDGRAVGSELIAQDFTGDEWLWPRPSAAEFDAMASSGSNLGPNNPDLVDAIEDRRAHIAQACGVAPGDVPADAVTASSSGLDPDISPAYAAIQVDRIARARGISPDEVRAAIAGATRGRTLGILGEPRVNAVRANAALAHR